MSRDRPIQAMLIALLLLVCAAAVFAAPNDPGHDTLYVLRIGDTNVTGSINLTQNLTASGISYATLLYGNKLDIRSNGTILTPSAVPAIQSDDADLYLDPDSGGVLYLSSKGGTTSTVQVGPRSGSTITFNVSGVIRQQGIAVCLANGTNCLTGNNSGNVSSVNAGNGISVTNPNGPAVTVSTSATTCGASEYSYWDGNSWECRADANSGGTGNITGSGTANTVPKFTGTGSIGNSIITDNGNVSIDTNTLFIDATNNRIGLGLTNPQTQLSMTGAMDTSQSSVRHYRNVIQYNYGTNQVNGTMKITMPNNWSNTMMVVRIVGYDYSGNGQWEVLVSGYNYAASTAWINYRAEIRGRAPFTQVRLAHDGTKNVILLGNTSTQWSYPKIVVADFIAGHNSIDSWGSGWAIANTTDETGIANIVTPAIDIYTSTAGNIGIGTAYPAQKLTVSGTANITGAAYMGNSKCSAGQYLTADATTGLLSCGAPAGTTYTNGTGILLNGNQFNLSTAYTDARYLGISATAANSNQLNTQQSTYYLNQTGITAANITSGTIADARIANASTWHAKAAAGNCPAGQVVMNTTSTGVQCVAVSGGTVTSSGSANYIPYMSTSTNIANSQIYQNGTNIGIGLINPSAKLQINEGSVYPGLTAINETAMPPYGLTIQSGPGASNPQGWAYPYGTRLSVYTGGGRSFEIMTTTYPDGQLAVRTANGTPTWDNWKLVLDSMHNVASSGNLQITGSGSHYISSGNVGIGTSSPSFKLAVNGGRGHFNASGEAYSLGVTRSEASSQTYWFGVSNGGAGGALQISDSSGNAMMVINDTGTTGNVGIGTTDPKQALHVASSGTRELYPSSAVFSDATNPEEAVFIGFNSTGNYGIIAASERGVAWRDIVLQPTAGNIGIGTTSPGEKLVVNGRINATTDVCITGGNCLSTVSAGAGSGNGWTNTSTTIYTNDTADNVAIGTATANQKLTVSGNANITGTLYASNISSNSPLQLQTAGTTRIYVNDSNGYVGIASTSPANYLQVGSVGSSGYGGNHIVAGDGTNVIAMNPAATNTFYTNNNFAFMPSGAGSVGRVGIGVNPANAKLEVVATSGEVFRADASGGAYRIVANQNGVIMNGNVGIGTANPPSKLHVVGTNMTLKSSTSSANIDFNILDADADIAGFRIRYDDSTGTTYLDNLYDSAAGDIYIRTKAAGTPVNALFIESAGNVGIGTSSPSSPLSIVGGDATTSTVKIQAPVYPMIDFNSTNGDVNNRNWRIASVYSSYGKLEILSSTASGGVPTTNRFTIDGSTGNVGIGTTSPNSKLEVTGMITANSSVASTAVVNIKVGGSTVGGTAASGAWEGDSTTDLAIYAETGKALRVYTGGSATERLTIDSSGNAAFSGPVQATNFRDGTGTYNVNLGSGGSEGRGLVAGYSGGSYGGIGYNVRHTAVGGQWIAPSTDTVSYLLFTGGGFAFYGAPAGAAGRTLNQGSTLTALATISSAGAVTATSFTGSGSGLTSVNADTLDSIDSTGFLTSGYLSGKSLADANNADTAGITTHYIGSTNKPTGTDHALLTLSYDSSWSVQLAGDWRTNTWYTRNQNSGTWGSWATMVSSANYNNYAGTTLVATGTGMSVTGDTATRSGGGAWDAQVYSTNGYTKHAYVSAKVDSLSYSYMFGLNTDPTADSSYCSIDYAWYITSSTNGYIYESCGNPASGITLKTGDVLAVVYDGTNVKYLQNGIVRRTVAASITNPLYFDSSFVSGASPSATISEIRVGSQIQNTVTTGSPLYRTAAGTGYLSGQYGFSGESTTTTGAIYTIGGDYYPTSSSLNNMYGIGYTNTAQGGMPSGASGWGMYVAGGGTARVWLAAETGNIVALGQIKAGTGTPGYATGAGEIYATGDLEVDGNFYGSGADLAERINASEADLAAGTVVELDPENPDSVRRSTGAYSKLVAGIVSTEPGIILGKDEGGNQSIELAVTGRVPVNVNTENGPIAVGDLLTTSSVPGEAMRCDEQARCFGAILGKAMEPLNTGSGSITALVVLG